MCAFIFMAWVSLLKDWRDHKSGEVIEIDDDDAAKLVAAKFATPSDPPSDSPASDPPPAAADAPPSDPPSDPPAKKKASKKKRESKKKPAKAKSGGEEPPRKKPRPGGRVSAETDRQWGEAEDAACRELGIDPDELSQRHKSRMIARGDV